ncbi:hypothetical protein GGD81_001282 [Rhodobium orientis]|uniref:hypothetical protein n=1 Tax=Rhodobium orientis TaxID=34017 RepID=UPI0017E77676|nr:hypothetical protein [Rhodobium orientis]MBB4302255.1 hypothetical protein [Rhodobium orientis]
MLTRFKLLRRCLFGFLTGLVLSAGPAGAAELLVLERDGCPWCERFDAEIAPIYPKTAEGRRAPLRRIDIHQPLPDDLKDIRLETFTPSFVLVEDGREIGRIRGYPGEEFFWFMLSELLAKLEKRQHSGLFPATPPPPGPGDAFFRRPQAAAGTPRPAVAPGRDFTAAAECGKVSNAVRLPEPRAIPARFGEGCREGRSYSQRSIGGLLRLRTV